MEEEKTIIEKAMENLFQTMIKLGDEAGVKFKEMYDGQDDEAKLRFWRHISWIMKENDLKQIFNGYKIEEFETKEKI